MTFSSFSSAWSSIFKASLWILKGSLVLIQILLYLGDLRHILLASTLLRGPEMAAGWLMRETVNHASVVNQATLSQPYLVRQDCSVVGFSSSQRPINPAGLHRPSGIQHCHILSDVYWTHIFTGYYPFLGIHSFKQFCLVVGLFHKSFSICVNQDGQGKPWPGSVPIRCVTYECLAPFRKTHSSGGPLSARCMWAASSLETGTWLVLIRQRASFAVSPRMLARMNCSLPEGTSFVPGLQYGICLHHDGSSDKWWSYFARHACPSAILWRG